MFSLFELSASPYNPMSCLVRSKFREPHRDPTNSHELSQQTESSHQLRGVQVRFANVCVKASHISDRITGRGADEHMTQKKKHTDQMIANVAF